MDYNSNVNQEIKSKFVYREIGHCISMLVSELLENGTYDELMEVCLKDDWEEPAEDYIRNLDRVTSIEYLEFAYKNICIASESIEKLHDMILKHAKEGDLQEFCEDRNLDPYRIEAYEHWIVSNYLARKLEAKGEMVLYDFLGLTIWGRACTGQAILLDNVISEICNEMEILDGQVNSWGPPKQSNEPLTKRLRQVRDALNKTKNKDVIEQIANLLNI